MKVEGTVGAPTCWFNIIAGALDMQGGLRSLCRSLRGHITRTAKTTEMAPMPNSTSGHVDMHGKLICTIYCWLTTDLVKNRIFEVFCVSTHDILKYGEDRVFVWTHVLAKLGKRKNKDWFRGYRFHNFPHPSRPVMSMLIILLNSDAIRPGCLNA
jgi:hypothetical protein